MHEPTRKLVIFGCGYIGTEVARCALAKGIEVTALTRNVGRAERLRSLGISTVVADLEGSAWHDLVADSPDYVLNAVSSGGGGPEGYRRSYVEGMRSIMRWAANHGPVGTFVYTSSTSVYPQGDGMIVDETAPHEGVSALGSILLEAEAVVRSASFRTVNTEAAASASARPDRTGAVLRRYFILRLAGIYGPDRHHLLDQVRGGVVAGRGEHRLNLVHRDDVCSAVMAAFGAPLDCGNEVLNVVDDHPSPKADVVAWLAGRLGVDVPGFSGLPAGTRRAVTPDRVIANGKIKQLLGWRPKYPSYREGYENILSRRSE